MNSWASGPDSIFRAKRAAGGEFIFIEYKELIETSCNKSYSIQKAVTALPNQMTALEVLLDRPENLAVLERMEAREMQEKMAGEDFLSYSR